MNKLSVRRTLAHIASQVSVVLGFVVLLTTVAEAQTLAGRWAAAGRTLDNGEQQKSILELKQDGSELTGSISTLGYTANITGKVTENHFEIYVPWNPSKAYLVGDLVNGELHVKENGRRDWVAKPSTADDVLPSIPYIEPEALHKVPQNARAKTPPMGWNSWNLFAGKVDDQTVRTMADAMVSSGMRDAGYLYVNIDDTWEGVRDAQGNLQPNHKIPGHEGTRRLRAFQRSEARHLFVAGTAHLRILSRKLWA